MAKRWENMVLRSMALALSAVAVACSSQPPPGATLSPDSLPLGTTLCAQSRTAPFTLSNTGGSPLHWSASAQDLSGVLVAPTSGTLAPGASETLSATLSLGATPKPGDMLSGNIVLTTDAPDQPTLTVPITATASGAVVRTVGPSVLDFGEIPLGALSPPQSVSLENAGDAPARLSTEGSLPFLLSFLAGGTLAPGGKDVLTGSFAPSALGPFERTASLALPDGLCGEPAKVTLKGRGVDGVVGISPGTVDFGDVDCGTGPVQKTFTILNTSLEPFDFALSPRPWPYKFSAFPELGTVPPGGSVTVTIGTIVGNDVDVGVRSDAIDVTTTAPKDKPHRVPVSLVARGVKLSWSLPKVSFGRVQIGQTNTASATLQSQANVPATVSLQATGPFAVSPSTAAVPGPSIAVDVTTGDPDTLGFSVQGSVSLSVVGAPLCGQLPTLPLDMVPYDRASRVAVGNDRVVLAQSGRVYQSQGYNSGYRRVAGIAGPVSDVAAQGNVACVRLASGGIQCWGNGLVGNGQTYSMVPVNVTGITDAIALVARYPRVCAILADHTARCWGYNDYGTFGTAATGPFALPTSIAGLGAIEQLSLGKQHQCARKADGSVWCWGAYGYPPEALGTRDANAERYEPAQVLGVPPATDLSATWGNNCILAAAGLVCWGESYASTGPVTIMTTELPVSGDFVSRTMLTRNWYWDAPEVVPHPWPQAYGMGAPVAAGMQCRVDGLGVLRCGSATNAPLTPMFGFD